MRKFFVFASLVIVFLFGVQSASADYRARVLGASTSSSNLQIPPTTEGPGWILPDSPLYFLDSLKQNVKLTLALAPEKKAKIHEEIAGERMAELRIMLLRNNWGGVRSTLGGISDNFQKASDELNQAQLTGKDVSVLAREINQNIKAKQQVLDQLETEATGSIKGHVFVTAQSLTEAKAKAEEFLPSDELENEIKDDLQRDSVKRAEQALTAAEELKFDLTELNKQASEASEKSLERREAAIKKAIINKNESLIRAEENLLEIEKQKQASLSKAQQETSNAVREVVEKAREAALNFQKVKQKEIEIKNSLSPSTSNLAE